MSSKLCKNKLYSSYFLGVFIKKIIYYFLLFTLFSKFTYYFVWRNLPTNSNYFTKIYLLFSVTLMIPRKIFACQNGHMWKHHWISLTLRDLPSFENWRWGRGKRDSWWGHCPPAPCGYCPAPLSSSRELNVVPTNVLFADSARRICTVI